MDTGDVLEHLLEGVDFLADEDRMHLAYGIDVTVEDRVAVLVHGLGLYSTRCLALVPWPLEDQVDREGEQVVDVRQRFHCRYGARYPEVVHLSGNLENFSGIRFFFYLFDAFTH